MKATITWLPVGLLALLMIATPVALSSQESGHQEGAVGTRPRDLGGHLELDMRFGDMMGTFAAFAGARGAIRLKQRVYLGIAGEGLATDNAEVQGPVPGATRALRMGYGGFLIGYVVRTRALVDLTADVLVGAGGVRLKDPDEDDALFVFEPSVGIGLWLAPIARLGLGAGYRFVGDVELPGVKDADLRGFNGTVSLRFGWF
jgi:hypothetical protein